MSYTYLNSYKVANLFVTNTYSIAETLVVVVSPSTLPVELAVFSISIRWISEKL